MSSLTKVIPVDSDHNLSDACTETSSSEMACDAQSVPAFESKGTCTFEQPAAQRVMKCGNVPSRRFCTLSISRHQTFLSVAGGLELFTLTGTSIQGGIQGSAGSVSNISDSSLFHAHFALS